MEKGGFAKLASLESARKMEKGGFAKLASLESARKILLANARESGSELVLLQDALGRVLAEDARAAVSVPHFEKSAMDGYAVRARDTFGAGEMSERELKLIDGITAGEVSAKKIRAGECIAITTGAPLPEGADAVLMVEYTESKGDVVFARRAVAPGENAIGVGSDIRKGEVVFEKGTRLSERHTGALAAIGLRRVRVAKRPKVAVLATGNEIVKVGAKLSAGKIYDINSRALVDGLRASGCAVVGLGIARDKKGEIKNAILRGVERAELVLLSGGSSLGSEDLVCGIIEELGELLVHGIAVKPGKPTIVGKVRGKLVLGLPGHPMSALSNFYILVMPVLEKMTGENNEGKFVLAELERKVVSTIGRVTFLPVKLNEGKAIPILKGSSAITSLSGADGFVEIPANREVLGKGERVRIRLF